MENVTVPSSAVSTMKSGVICCMFLPSVSPSDAPGLGFKRRSSEYTVSAVVGEMFSCFTILSQCLFMNSSKYLSMTFSISRVISVSGRLLICSSRHSRRSEAPMPAGSKVCSRVMTFLTSSSVQYML